MRIQRIKYSFIRLGDAEFIQFGEAIIDGLTDNPFFPEMNTALQPFSDAFKAFQESIPTPSERSPARINEKNAKKEVAIMELVYISYLVAYQAKSDVVALESSNFELVSLPQARSLVGLVKNLNLRTNGVEGMVIVSCDRDVNASLYNVRISLDGVDWKWMRSSNSRTVKISNLPIGQKLFVQMQLQNSQGTGPWSQSKIGVILGAEAIPSIHE